MTTLPPSPFTDSAAFSPFTAECSASVVMPLADTDAAPNSPPVAASVPNSALERAIAADTATAPHLTDPAVAVAGVIAESSMSTGGHQEAPAAPPNSMAAGATDCIGEIFHYARKLIDEDASKLSAPRFVLDETRFMAELFDEAMRQELIMPSFLAAPSQAYLRAIA